MNEEDDIIFTEDKLVAAICSASFYDFVQEFWDTIIPEVPVWNWHIKYLCDELQTMAERVFEGKSKEYDLVINISPGSTKSSIASVMFVPWVWTTMPSARFIYGSHGYSLAMDLSRKCRDILLSDKYQRIYPDVQLREDQNAKAEYHTTKGGMRYAIGTGGSVIGRHAHFLMVDDPIDPTAAVSEADLRAANQWMTETLPTRKVDKKVSVLVLIMQRLHMSDPTGEMLEKAEGEAGKKIKHICIPAEATKDIHPSELKEFYVDGLMDPNRLPLDVLEAQKIDLGPYGYAGQFLQSPIPAGGGMFQCDKIGIGRRPRRMKKTVRYWDKAGTAGGGAFTAGVKLGLDMDNRIWIMHVVREQVESAERERIMQQTAEFDGNKTVIGIEQEPGSGGKESAQGSVRNLMGYLVIVDRPQGDKVLRADPLSVQVNNGNFWVDERDVGSFWFRTYKKEMIPFPYSKYKDQIDATSGAFNLLIKKKRRAGGLQ